MGLAEHAAELAGWGPVIADIARQIADQRADGTSGVGGVDNTVWRFSITDPITGALLHHGVTRRPSRTAGAYAGPAQVPHTQAAGVRHRPRPHLPRTRLPVPARRTEIDHLKDHAKGGRTEVGNLDCKCSSCHDLKDSGWKVIRSLIDDTTTWTSLLGHRYRIPGHADHPPLATQPRRTTPPSKTHADERDRLQLINLPGRVARRMVDQGVRRVRHLSHALW